MVTKVDPNVQIAKFLDYYFKIPAPKYAVMLKGPWGSGKTWFIEEQLKLVPKNQKTLYVSLYGMSSKAEIEEQFFAQLHPFLAHKGTRLVGKVLKSALKATVKVDWDGNGDGKSDGTVSAGIPDLNVADLLKNSKGGLNLIFDDVERCEIPLSQLFGYINYFVEHDQTRVVLLANEEEIIAKERRCADAADQTKEEIQYLRVREKLIGKTFDIHPDLPRALSTFLQELGEGTAKATFSREQNLVAELHACSGYKNLRHLRQAVLDFDRLVGQINAETRNDEMLRGILGTFLVYTFEIRSSSLAADEIRTSDSWLALTKDDGKDVARDLRKKYPTLEVLDSVFSSELWANMMGSGLLDREAIQAAVMQSKFYSKETDRPNWLRLWDAFSMEDNALGALLVETENRLQNCEYTVLGELMHVTGALISLASINVYATPARQTVKLALANIDQFDLGKLQPDEDNLMEQDSWAGRMFHGADRPEFQAFRMAVRKKQALGKVASHTVKAAELLEALLKKDSAAFARPIAWNRSGDGQFASEPVLAAINPKDFVQAVEKLNSVQLKPVGLAIKRRYQNNRAELASEKKWLNAVAKLLTPWTRQKGTMHGFYLRVLRDDITKAVESFQKKTVESRPTSKLVAS